MHDHHEDAAGRHVECVLHIRGVVARVGYVIGGYGGRVEAVQISCAQYVVGAAIGDHYRHARGDRVIVHESVRIIVPGTVVGVTWERLGSLAGADDVVTGHAAGLCGVARRDRTHEHLAVTDAGCRGDGPGGRAGGSVRPGRGAGVCWGWSDRPCGRVGIDCVAVNQRASAVLELESHRHGGGVHQHRTIIRIVSDDALRQGRSKVVYAPPTEAVYYIGDAIDVETFVVMLMARKHGRRAPLGERPLQSRSTAVVGTRGIRWVVEIDYLPGFGS